MTLLRLLALVTLAVAVSGCGLAHRPLPPGQAKQIVAPPGQAKKLILPPPAWGGRMQWI